MADGAPSSSHSFTDSLSWDPMTVYCISGSTGQPIDARPSGAYRCGRFTVEHHGPCFRQPKGTCLPSISQARTFGPCEPQTSFFFPEVFVFASPPLFFCSSSPDAVKNRLRAPRRTDPKKAPHHPYRGSTGRPLPPEKARITVLQRQEATLLRPTGR